MVSFAASPLPFALCPLPIAPVPMLDQITPLILTFNEAPNIERTLSRLKWAKEIIVVDSFSTDETCDLVRKLPQTRILQREFVSFARQCNFGLQHIRTEWVLSLDADYLLSEECVAEVTDLRPSEEVAGYRAAFRYCISGRPLRASLYPPRVVLYRRARARYRDEGHGHRAQVEGTILPLRSVIHHDDRKPLDRWLREQDRYARLEAEHLLGDRRWELGVGRSKMEVGSWRIELDQRSLSRRAWSSFTRCLAKG
jgi:glycosyltransferase involved in cell wall biosynthesis